MLVERGGGAAPAGDDEDVLGAVFLGVVAPPVGGALGYVCRVGRDLEFACLQFVAEVVGGLVKADGVECVSLFLVALAECCPEPRGIVTRADRGERAACGDAGELAGVADLDDLGVLLAEKGGELGEVACAGHAGFVDDRDQGCADGEVFVGVGEDAADGGGWDACVIEFAGGAGGGCCADDVVAGGAVGVGDGSGGGRLAGARERFDVLDRVPAAGDGANDVALLVGEVAQSARGRR